MAKSVDPDEVAHYYELPNLNLHSLQIQLFQFFHKKKCYFFFVLLVICRLVIVRYIILLKKSYRTSVFVLFHFISGSRKQQET